MFRRSLKFEKSFIIFFPTRFSSNFKSNGKQFTTQWDKFVTQCNRLFVLYGDPEVMKLALHEIKILAINATFISSTTLNVMYMCITEKKKTEVSSESNSYFLKPMDPQRFFSQVKWSIYMRRKNIVSSSLLVGCLFRKGGGKVENPPPLLLHYPAHDFPFFWTPATHSQLFYP